MKRYFTIHILNNIVSGGAIVSRRYCVKFYYFGTLLRGAKCIKESDLVCHDSFSLHLKNHGILEVYFICFNIWKLCPLPIKNTKISLHYFDFYCFELFKLFLFQRSSLRDGTHNYVLLNYKRMLCSIFLITVAHIVSTYNNSKKLEYMSDKKRFRTLYNYSKLGEGWLHVLKGTSELF